MPLLAIIVDVITALTYFSRLNWVLCRSIHLNRRPLWRR